MNIFSALASREARQMLAAILDQRLTRGAAGRAASEFDSGGLPQHIRAALVGAGAASAVPVAGGAAGIAANAAGYPLSNAYDPSMRGEMAYGAGMATLGPLVGAGALMSGGPLRAYDELARLSANVASVAYGEGLLGDRRDARMPRAPNPTDILYPRRRDRRRGPRPVVNVFGKRK